MKSGFKEPQESGMSIKAELGYLNWDGEHICYVM